MQARKLANILLSILCLQAIMVYASDRNYPYPRKNPITVGNENFHPEYMSLQGLEGIYLNLDNVESALLKTGAEFTEEYREELETVITDAGILLLDQESVRWSPGQPIMNIYPTLDEDSASVVSGVCSYDHLDIEELKTQLVDEDGNVVSIPLPKLTAEEMARVTRFCGNLPPRCSSSLWAGFTQSASILRQPLREYRLGTWGSGDEHHACSGRAEWLKTAVKTKLEDFVSDYKKAQQEQMPHFVSKVSDLPRNCAQSWMMVDGVFDTNETLITKKANNILERYVEFTADCNGFGYVVEAHDDNHADSQYNQILRTARAEAVKELMNSKGIHFKRIKIRSQNEEVPFISGTLEQALLTGSIIVYPQSPIEFANLELDY